MRVDGVVVVDDLLGAGEVAFDEGVGAGADRTRRERTETNEVDPDVVDAGTNRIVRLCHSRIIFSARDQGAGHRLHCFPAVHLRATTRTVPG